MLSNGTIFKDLERPLTSISRSRGLTPVFDAEYLGNVLLKGVISNDLE